MELNDSQIRAKKGNVASIVGIVLNVLLGGIKIAVGAVFGVISLVADGLNNMTDCGNSVISAVSFKLSSRPADKEHPYGHERVEYVCSLAVAFLVLLVAFETAKESVGKIITPTETEFSYWVIGALALSVVAKTLLYVYYKSTAKKINSSILSASAVDCLTDCVSTVVVAISFLISEFTGVNVDGFAGVLVALFIGWSAVGILKEILSKLIGQAPDKELLTFIKDKIKAHEGVLDVHDLSVYSYGPNKYFASVHIEVDANMDVLVSHELIDDIEREFANDTNVVLTGHLDPIVTDNEQVNAVKVKVNDIVKGIDKDFSMHDFRMVFGENHTNLLFDVSIPYGTALSKGEISAIIEQKVKEIDPKFRVVLTIEHSV